MGARAGETGVVPGHHEERHEDEQRDREEQEDVRGDPPDHETAHFATLPSDRASSSRVYDGPDEHNRRDP